MIDNQTYTGDVSDVLPQKPKEKLRSLRQALDDYRLLSNEASEKWNEAQKRKHDADTAFKVLTDHEAASR